MSASIDLPIDDPTDIKFNVFGSASSRDTDVFIPVKHMPEKIDIGHKICSALKYMLTDKYGDKDFNVNIGVIEYGVIVKCFKGSPDETNNSIYNTYAKHPQNYERLVMKSVDRDVKTKILRATRIILSLLTRAKIVVDGKTEDLRSKVKKVLTDNKLCDRIDTLKTIDFENLTFRDGEDEKDIKDNIKTIAFQIGQTLALIDGKEIYTKEDVGVYNEKLRKFVMREDYPKGDIAILNEMICLYCTRIEELYKDDNTLKFAKEKI